MSDPAGGDEKPGVSEERLDRLEDRIDELSTELRARRRGPFGIPRPPSPGAVLSFADEHALPTAIAILEANLRALRMLRAVTGSMRGVDRDAARDRKEGVAKEAMAELDRALADLREAIESGGLPENDRARGLLEELRSIRSEVDAALESDPVEASSDEDAADDDPSTALDQSGQPTAEPDVADELESIKRSVRGVETAEDGDPTESAENPSADSKNGGGADSSTEENQGEE